MKHIGRKLYHLLGGLGLLSLYFILGRERALWIYIVLAGGVLIVEVARLRVPSFNRYFFAQWGSFVRESERERMTGTMPYVLGIGLSLLLYRTDIATAAICFLAVGDVAATTVGERYGRTKLVGQKSLEGTLAFFGAAALAGIALNLAGIHLMHGLLMAGALTAAAVELLPLPLNDNLTVPLASGGAMELISRLTGCA